MSDFFTWMRIPALDSRDAPKNESLAEHLKHCKAKKECPFEKKSAAMKAAATPDAAARVADILEQVCC